MSQLSFADVFNMARETAENSPVIQVRAMRDFMRGIQEAA